MATDFAAMYPNIAGHDRWMEDRERKRQAMREAVGQGSQNALRMFARAGQTDAGTMAGNLVGTLLMGALQRWLTRDKRGGGNNTTGTGTAQETGTMPQADFGVGSIYDKINSMGYDPIVLGGGATTTQTTYPTAGEAAHLLGSLGTPSNDYIFTAPSVTDGIGYPTRHFDLSDPEKLNWLGWR